jgi:tight adherence protein C
MIAPSLWLDHRKRKRQASLRRALPDALDLLVLCLEGGGTLPAAIQRVAEDLEAAHPLLAAEWGIIQKEMRMGLSAGDAVRRFGERCDLEDVRELAAVLLQSERFGAGVAKALRMHADSFRAELQQRAEETAQKASVKILFPTLLCIFPAIFIVLLGPAAYQIAAMLSRTR